jgi:hypothetical protein
MGFHPNPIVAYTHARDVSIVVHRNLARYGPDVRILAADKDLGRG